jgi:hypothetical protein
LSFFITDAIAKSIADVVVDAGIKISSY